MLQKSKKYRHPNCMDVDIKVVYVTDFDETKDYYTVHWIHRMYKYTIALDNIFIKKEHLKNWSELNE